MEAFIDVGMGPHRPRVRRDLDMFRGAPLSARWLHVTPRRSVSSRRGWAFYTVRGGIEPGDHCFRPRIMGEL